MGLGSGLRKGLNRAKSTISGIGSRSEDWARKSGVATAAEVFANPLIAQDIMASSFGGKLSRGADTRTAFATSTDSGNIAATAAGQGNSQTNWDLAAFNAALAAGAVGYPTALGMTGNLAPLAATGLAAGTTALAYGATQSLANAAGGSGQDLEAGIPPDVNYANDPEAQMQFKRLRRAAALLGRAGTIRAKGAANLGSTQPLGTDMALA